MRLSRLVMIGALVGAVGCESGATVNFGQGCACGGGGGGAVTRLSFTTQPTGGTSAGSLIGAVQVSSVNVFGTTDTAFAGDVTIALGPGSGSAVLGGTTTVTASFGVATFSDLTVSTSGTFVLVASSSGFSRSTSQSFVVNP